MVKFLSFFLILTGVLGSCKNKATLHTDSFDAQSKILFNHYSQKSDSLKLRAAKLIVKNLKHQFYFSSNNIECFNQILQSGPNPSIARLCFIRDSLDYAYGTSLNKYPDSHALSAQDLIENIEYAFTAWQMPWARDYSFEQFSEYILPYKSANEKPELWRKKLFNTFRGVVDSVSDKTDLNALCKIVNKRLSSMFAIGFGYSHRVDVGFDLACKIKTGDCHSASKMTLYAMRSVGIPVVIDFTPHWGNRNSGHSWNALIYSDDKLSRFVGSESNPGLVKEYVGPNDLIRKFSKVYRRTFLDQPNSLASITDEKLVPALFRNYHIKDVTDMYTLVSDVELKFEKNIKHKFVYLCVFDNKSWQAIHWSSVKNGKALFTKMGRDIAYLPMFYEKEKLIPAGDPFILNRDGSISIHKPQANKTESLLLTRKYPNNESNKIVIGDRYEVFYWNDEWKSLGKQEATKNFLSYQDVPLNALFWIRNLSRGKQERIFTYMNGKQVWW